MRRVFVLGADAGRQMLASRRAGPVCVQAMQQLTLSRGVLSGQCSASGFQPFNKISDRGDRNPLSPCSSAPLFSRATARPPSGSHRSEARPATRGTFDGAVAVLLFSPGLEPTDLTSGVIVPDTVRFPVSGPEEASRLARAIYLRADGWRLEVVDQVGQVVASRQGPDPRPRRGVVSKGGAR